MAEKSKKLKPKTVIIHGPTEKLYRQTYENTSRSSTRDTVVDKDRHKKMLLLNPEDDELKIGQNTPYKTAYNLNKKEANKWKKNINQMRHEYKQTITKYIASKTKKPTRVFEVSNAPEGGRRTRKHSRRNISRRRRHVGRRRTHRNGA